MSIRNILYLYILRIYGVDNSDEFEYKIVNMTFPVSFKVYIKKIACYPQLINKDIYDTANTINLLINSQMNSKGLKSSVSCTQSKHQNVLPLPLSVKDRLFINLLTIESKKQA